MFRQVRIAVAVCVTLAAVVALVAVANAQTPTEGEPTDTAETPADGATPTEGEPDGIQETNARVFVVVPDGEFKKDDTFEAEVRIENAEHVAAFSFSLEFDPDKLTVVDENASVEGVQFGTAIGEFLTLGERENISCDIPEIVGGNRAAVVCVTNDPPVCLGGPAGASGDGTLGVIEFSVVGDDDTDLTIPASKLILDDFVDCTSPQTVEAVPATEGATIQVEGEGFNWLIVGGVVAVVAVLAAGGAFAYVRSRQGTRNE